MTMTLRSSSAPTFMHCGASEHFPQPRPDTDSDASLEGTCAAWVAEVVINGDASSAEDMLGESHTNGWVVNEDMVRHIDGYIAMLAKRDIHTAECFMKHPTLPMQGTADDIGWTTDMTTLFITDLKYGYGIVEVDTWQLVAYMLLVLSNLQPHQYPKMIQLAIYQPRAIHPDGIYRRKVISIQDALVLCQQMEQRITQIVTGDNLASPGNQCKYCTKAIGCHAVTASVYQMLEPIESRAYLQPTPQQLSDELTMLRGATRLFEARKAAIEAEVETTINGGGFVPGWQLEKRYGKKKFTVDPMTIQILTGIDPKDDGVCTPAELIRRGALEATVKTITNSPFIGVKLAPFTTVNMAPIKAER